MTSTEAIIGEVPPQPKEEVTAKAESNRPLSRILKELIDAEGVKERIFTNVIVEKENRTMVFIINDFTYTHRCPGRYDHAAASNECAGHIFRKYGVTPEEMKNRDMDALNKA